MINSAMKKLRWHVSVQLLLKKLFMFSGRRVWWRVHHQDHLSRQGHRGLRDQATRFCRRRPAGCHGLPHSGQRLHQRQGGQTRFHHKRKMQVPLRYRTERAFEAVPTAASRNPGGWGFVTITTARSHREWVVVSFEERRLLSSTRAKEMWVSTSRRLLAECSSCCSE